MSAQIEQTLSSIEATYKAHDLEGIFDLRFYRPIGFRLAQLFARLKATPSQITFVGAVIGVVAGHLYFYRNLAVNIVGMVLQVVANIFDNVDGQLARLTNQKSRIGRAIDGLGDHVVFASVYLHLALRYMIAGHSPAVGLLALAAALSHGWQAAVTDYFRNTYLLIMNGQGRAEADLSSVLQADFDHLTGKNDRWKKLLTRMYLNFTRTQERLAPKLHALREKVARSGSEGPAIELHRRFQELGQPLLKWWGLLMTNARMVLLFVFLFIGQPIGYFWIELTALNLLAAILLFRQETMATTLLDLADVDSRTR